MRVVNVVLAAVVLPLALFVGPAGASPLTPAQAVPGLKPATADYAAVIALYKKWEDSTYAQSEASHWSIATSGPTRTIVWDGDDFRQDDYSGPFHSAHGRYHGQNWDQNDNGYTILLTHGQSNVTNDAVNAALAGKVSPDVALIGEVDAPVAAYVLEAKPQGGIDLLVFVDKNSGAVERNINISGEIPYITTFDDGRTVNGVFRWWHVHGAYANGKSEFDRRMTSYTTTLTAGEKQSLQIPPNRRIVLEFPRTGKNEVHIPARFFKGTIVVRATINGRGMDFELDSGSGAIFMNAQVVHELGVRQLGGRALIPEMRIGELTIHNLAVSSLPWSYYPGGQTEIVGLLGFDFIADAVLKIDYKNETVTAITGPFSPPRDAYSVSVDLDGKVPIMSAVMGRSQGEFLVDSGSFSTMIFPEFARAHRDDVKEVGSDFHDWNYPLIRAEGVGGSFPVKAVNVENMNLGAFRFTQWSMLEVGPNSSFGSGGDVAGLIGQDLLRFFDVYFDYANSIVYFVPNDDLKQFKVSK